MNLRRLFIPDFKGSRDLIAIAWPVVLAHSTFTVALAFNTAFLGRVSPEAQGVAAVGDIALLVVCLTFAGLSIGGQVLVARRLGEGSATQSGAVLDNMLLAAFLLGSLFTVSSFFFLPVVCRYLFATDELCRMGVEFMQVRFLGVLPFIIFASFRGFFIGIGVTKHFLISTSIRLVVNVFLDYALIFGKFGCPEMGLVGAAWAGTIAQVVSALYFLIVVLLKSYRHRFNVFRFSNLSFGIMKRLLNLSAPAGLRQLIGMGAYLLFFRIIGEIGTNELAAANVVRSTANLVFMPVLGFSVAVSSLVSRNLGEGRPQKARKNTWRAMHLGIWSTVIIYAFIVLFASEVSRLFTSDPTVVRLGTDCFRYAGFFLLAIAPGLMFGGALEGAGKIWLILMLELFCIAIYLVSAYLFGISLGWGVIGAYNAELAYWISFGLILGVAFLQSDLQKAKI